jgi:hypothetical protein
MPKERHRVRSAEFPERTNRHGMARHARPCSTTGFLPIPFWQAVRERSSHHALIAAVGMSSSSLGRLILVDRTGFLAELYSLADAAIVGGGFDGQIHNTLEPAAHPVPVLVGHHLERSPEAEALVREGAARAFSSAEPLFQFLGGCVRVGEATGTEGLPSSPGAALVELRLRALELFKSIPSTSEVVSAALFESLVASHPPRRLGPSPPP